MRFSEPQSRPLQVSRDREELDFREKDGYKENLEEELEKVKPREGWAQVEMLRSPHEGCLQTSPVNSQAEAEEQP